MNRERGFILPIALGICTLISFICFLWLSQTIRAQQATRLYGEQLRVQYALDSGVAQMQFRLKHGHSRPLTLQRAGVTVQVSASQEPSSAVLKARARGRWGVEQQMRVELDPQTWQVRRQLPQE